MKYQINFTDHRTGATIAIDLVEREEQYTSEQYIKECSENAADAWNEMLTYGTVTVEII